MSAASPSPLMPRPERLLVVEDDVFSQDLIALYLRKAGFSDITVTGDGREALEIAKSRTFDLVLLDLNLPRLSGTEVLRRLRKEGFLTDTPVIVISSLANMEDTLTCLDLGAEDSLPKPFNVRLLEGRVSACLEKARLKTAARLAVDRAEGERRLALALMESLCRVALPTPGPGFAAEVAVERRPCGGPGGDVVVSLAPPGGRVVVALGTLAARGVEGTLIAARLHAALRATLDDTPDAPPEVLLTRVAAAAGRDGAGGRVLVASLDPTDGTLLVSSAGAIDPVVIRPGAPPRPLAIESGRGLGERGAGQRPADRLILAPGEALVAWSPGLTGAIDATGTLYGERRLREALGRSAPSDDAATVAAGVMADLHRFCGSSRPDDDATLLVLRRLPEGEAKVPSYPPAGDGL